jgi:hypothetical protein
LIHIDFAENYVCCYSSEIQSVHFGGSHAQATLHDGVLYSQSNEHDLIATSFCTISDSRHHGPAAIWTYLDPVLKFVKSFNSAVDTVHFFSDSHSTQYRQKLNFLYFCTKIQNYGFRYGTWNFSEAGHGKGAADGVGGSLKRTADRLISLGTDINTPRQLFDAHCSSGSNIKLFYVSSEDVDVALQNETTSVKHIPGTMNIHQLTCFELAKVRYRDVSCFCSPNCNCYSPKEFAFEAPMPSVNTPNVDSDPVSLKSGEWTSIDELNLNLVEQFCLVKYDGKAYPGKILQVDIDDDDALIRCMARVGDNRFFWPVCEDVAWYMRNDILTLIQEPTAVGRGRHCQVDPLVWSRVLHHLH